MKFHRDLRKTQGNITIQNCGFSTEMYGRRAHAARLPYISLSGKNVNFKLSISFSLHAVELHEASHICQIWYGKFICGHPFLFNSISKMSGCFEKELLQSDCLYKLTYRFDWLKDESMKEGFDMTLNLDLCINKGCGMVWYGMVVRERIATHE